MVKYFQHQYWVVLQKKKNNGILMVCDLLHKEIIRVELKKVMD